MIDPNADPAAEQTPAARLSRCALLRAAIGLAGGFGAGGAPAWTPFIAWAASPGDGQRGIAFTMPVHPTWGLLLSAETGPAGSCGQTVSRLDVGGGRGMPKLRVGTYLLAPAGTDWTGWSPGDWGPAAFDSLVLTVARA